MLATRIINSERLIMVLQPTNQTTTTKYEKDVLILLVVTPVTRKKKTRVLPTGVEPMTFWLLVQMLYHRATGDSWELRP